MAVFSAPVSTISFAAFSVPASATSFATFSAPASATSFATFSAPASAASFATFSTPASAASFTTFSAPASTASFATFSTPDSATSFTTFSAPASAISFAAAFAPAFAAVEPPLTAAYPDPTVTAPIANAATSMPAAIANPCQSPSLIALYSETPGAISAMNLAASPYFPKSGTTLDTYFSWNSLVFLCAVSATSFVPSLIESIVWLSSKFILKPPA